MGKIITENQLDEYKAQRITDAFEHRLLGCETTKDTIILNKDKEKRQNMRQALFEMKEKGLIE